MNAVQQAIKEGRLQFFANGSYRYTPSQEYLNKFKREKAKAVSYLQGLKDAVDKLDRLDKAFQIAKERGKRVSHVSFNRIHLV